MKTSKWTGMLAAGVLALGLGAGCGMRRHGGDPAKVQEAVTEGLEDVLDDLDATDDQKRRIGAIKDRLLPGGMALATEHRAARAEILTELEKERPDAARLHALVDARAEALRRYAHQLVDGTVEAHAALTPEQRGQLTKRARRHLR